MANKKFKLTGFARFLFVMLILAPLAYIGASYLNGEDGIENIKDLFKGKVSLGTKSIETTTDEATKTVDIPKPVATQESVVDQSILDEKEEKIQALMESNQNLKTALEEKTKELEEVKADLKAINDALSRNQE